MRLRHKPRHDQGQIGDNNDVCAFSHLDSMDTVSTISNRLHSLELWKRIAALLLSVGLGFLLVHLWRMLILARLVWFRPGPELLCACALLTLYSLRNGAQIIRKCGVMLICCWSLFLEYLPHLLGEPDWLSSSTPFIWMCMGVIPQYFAVLLVMSTPNLEVIVKWLWVTVMAFIQSVYYLQILHLHYYCFFIFSR